MAIDEQFTQWATLFFRSFRQNEVAAGLIETPASLTPGIQYVGVTPAASELLRSVDAGGVPAFVTSSLRRIAEDNGIDITSQWSPNQIVAAIRGKASIAESEPAATAK